MINSPKVQKWKSLSPTLCDPVERKVKVKVKSLSRVRLLATPSTVVHQAPPSMGFSRQEYWSGLPFPSPGDLPDPGIEPRSPALQGRHFNLRATREALTLNTILAFNTKEDVGDPDLWLFIWWWKSRCLVNKCLLGYAVTMGNWVTSDL